MPGNNDSEVRRGMLRRWISGRRLFKSKSKSTLDTEETVEESTGSSSYGLPGWEHPSSSKPSGSLKRFSTKAQNAALPAKQSSYMRKVGHSSAVFPRTTHDRANRQVPPSTRSGRPEGRAAPARAKGEQNIDLNASLRLEDLLHDSQSEVDTNHVSGGCAERVPPVSQQFCRSMSAIGLDVTKREQSPRLPVIPRCNTNISLEGEDSLRLDDLCSMGDDVSEGRGVSYAKREEASVRRVNTSLASGRDDKPLPEPNPRDFSKSTSSIQHIKSRRRVSRSSGMMYPSSTTMNPHERSTQLPTMGDKRKPKDRVMNGNVMGSRGSTRNTHRVPSTGKHMTDFSKSTSTIHRTLPPRRIDPRRFNSSLNMDGSFRIDELDTFQEEDEPEAAKTSNRDHVAANAVNPQRIPCRMRKVERHVPVERDEKFDEILEEKLVKEALSRSKSEMEADREREMLREALEQSRIDFLAEQEQRMLEEALQQSMVDLRFEGKLM